jgi:hypothetical protein
MAIYFPTIFGIFGIILLIIAFFIPKVVKDEEGNIKRNLDITVKKTLLFSGLILVVIFILYIIYCLNMGYYFIKDIQGLNYVAIDNLKYQASKNTSEICIYISWILSLLLLGLGILSIIMILQRNRKNNKTEKYEIKEEKYKQLEEKFKK